MLRFAFYTRKRVFKQARKAEEEYTEAIRQISSYNYKGADEILNLLEENQSEKKWESDNDKRMKISLRAIIRLYTTLSKESAFFFCSVTR